MSNSSLQPDPDALRESAIAVITYVRDAMNSGVALLMQHDDVVRLFQSDHWLGAEIEAVKENLRHICGDLERVNRQLKIAIVGERCRGKSTIINAILGQDLLPNYGWTNMTILPTEIIFSREVTRPELYLDDDLKVLLLDAGLQLSQKLHQIGEEEAVKQATRSYVDKYEIEHFFRRYGVVESNSVRAEFEEELTRIDRVITDLCGFSMSKEVFKQATKNHFLREDVVASFLRSNSNFSRSEVIESDYIQLKLGKINDLLELCLIFGIATDFLSSLSQIPRIKVPFPQQLSSLAGLGLENLMLVDTPAINVSSNLQSVVECQLESSSIILLVLSCQQAGSSSEKRFYSEAAKIKGSESIYILINSIDTLKSPKEMMMVKKHVLKVFSSEIGIEASTDRVFEISASLAACVSNFRTELHLNPNISDPKLMETSEDLAREVFGEDNWEDELQEATIERMIKGSDRIWSKSGFGDFLEKVITPLVTDSVPKMITIKGALNDNSDRFTSFLSCLSKWKGILERDIQELEIKTNQLKIDLIEVHEFEVKNESKKYISSSLLKKFVTFFRESTYKAEDILRLYSILEKEYVEFLGKNANLEKDLKYLQKYFDGIK
jgi:hypothetical protein